MKKFDLQFLNKTSLKPSEALEGIGSQSIYYSTFNCDDCFDWDCGESDCYVDDEGEVQSFDCADCYDCRDCSDYVENCDDCDYDCGYDCSTDCESPKNSTSINTSTFYLKVAGVTYDNRQSIIKTLKAGDKLKFRAETNNVYDAYAVSVLTSDGRCIGFIDKEHNQSIHKNLKAGKEYNVEVANITGGGYGMNYGVNIKVAFKTVETTSTQKLIKPSTSSISKTSHIPYSSKSYFAESKEVRFPLYVKYSNHDFYIEKSEKWLQELRDGQTLWFKIDVNRKTDGAMILTENGKYVGSIGGENGKEIYKKLKLGSQFKVTVKKTSTYNYYLGSKSEIQLKIELIENASSVVVPQAVQNYGSKVQKDSLKSLLGYLFLTAIGIVTAVLGFIYGIVVVGIIGIIITICGGGASYYALEEYGENSTNHKNDKMNKK